MVHANTLIASFLCKTIYKQQVRVLFQNKCVHLCASATFWLTLSTELQLKLKIDFIWLAQPSNSYCTSGLPLNKAWTNVFLYSFLYVSNPYNAQFKKGRASIHFEVSDHHKPIDSINVPVFLKLLSLRELFPFLKVIKDAK